MSKDDPPTGPRLTLSDPRYSEWVGSSANPGQGLPLFLATEESHDNWTLQLASALLCSTAVPRAVSCPRAVASLIKTPLLMTYSFSLAGRVAPVEQSLEGATAL